MIEEAIRFSTDLDPDRTEFYPDDHVLFDRDFRGELDAHRLMGDEVYFSPSGDAMDTDIEMHPSDDLGRMEREMMGQGRYPNHHHDGDDDDLDLDLLGDDLDTYNSGDDLVMERQKIRQMISDALKQG